MLRSDSDKMFHLRLSLFIYANRLASRTVTDMVRVYVRALVQPQ